MSDRPYPKEQTGDGAIIATPVLKRLSDVTPRPVEWLWAGRFAIGKLTLIAGDPGLGKSFVTLDMAARVSRGTPWPDRRDEPIPAGDVILLSAEDDLEDTIRPRLDAAGADVLRIQAIQGVNYYDADSQRATVKSFNLEVDLPALESAIGGSTDCRLVVVDPISAFCGRADGHKNTDVRALLAPLAKLAADHRVAVVAVTHLNKGGGANALYRAMGSLAFVAAARAVWLVTKDAENPSRRLFLPAKNNLAPDAGTGLAYSLLASNPDDAAVVAWEAEPVTIRADEALAAQERQGDERKKGKVDASADWLREQLEPGPLPMRELERRAREAGMSWASVRRAQHVLGVRPRKCGEGPWLWTLPGKDAQPSPVAQVEHLEHLQAGAIENADFEGADRLETTEDAQLRSVSTFDQVGHLPNADPTLGGLVPEGWEPARFADRREQLADLCEPTHPDAAAEHRRVAAAIRAALQQKGGDSP